MAEDVFAVERYFIEEKPFTLWDRGFHVLDEDGKKKLYVDLPSFQMTMRLDFYADEKKDEKLLVVSQDQVLFATGRRFTLKDRQGGILARFKADLGDNILQRTIEIVDANGEPICKLAAGGPGAKPQFTFQSEDDVLGRFEIAYEQPKRPGKFCLDLRGELGARLDSRIALAAAILLYARLS